MTYDSREDTLNHIFRVRELLDSCVSELEHRAWVHDDSKLKSPEKEVFDRVTPKLKALTYGSDEYRASLAEMGEALSHHYAHNSHHPEHHAEGINGMDLFDLVEMLMDWKAASERHADGDIWTSIDKNKERFHMSNQLYDILRNTASHMKW